MADQLQQYNESFQEELAKLNPAQRQAVEQIEGPVLVVAGPGTGKTHILASRIGRILLDTDTQATNILCLTFTDAGVRAMRQRLLQLIGPEAHRVHIFTFHSFCNSVIQDNLAYFGKQGLEPISELEQVELIRELLDQLDMDHPLKRGKVQRYFYEKHLRHLFQLMKTEDWSIKELLFHIGTYLDELPQRPEFRYQRKHGRYVAGDLKEAKWQKEKDRMELLRAAVHLFSRYEQLLEQNHRYDYADMILWVVSAFQENELLLRTYQEQYLYFLVDEYQDTNGAQNEILKLLTSFWDIPNLFIVGDDDQSIFEFQGARLRNLTEYYERYQDTMEVVVLENNYRSTQSILDTSKVLIDHNEHRLTQELAHLGIEKNLRAHHPQFQDSSKQVRLLEYPNQLQEEAAVLDQVQQWQQSGIPWGEIAIIYARHSQVLNLQTLLDKQGIPYQAKRQTNVLDTQLVRQWRELLTYFHLEHQRTYSGDHLLFRILYYRCWQLSSIDLAQLVIQKNKLSTEERMSWRELLQNPDHWPENLQQKERLLEIGRWLEETIGLLHDLSLPAFAERVLNGSGLLHYALSAADRLWQIQIAKSFFDFIRAEVQRRPRLELPDLLRTLDQMDSNFIALPLQKEIELENGVHLVTAHSAKGLEFQCVVVLDATKDYWEAGRRAGNTRFSLPDTLTLSGAEYETEARRRLFYVAMTRAKEQLHISYARENAKGKNLQRCLFVDELIEGQQLTVAPQTVPAEKLLLTELLHLEQSERPQIPAMEKAAIDKILADFQLSVSSLNRYLNCPLSFFYEVILQAPHWQREAASYGLAMHNTLQYVFDTMMADPDRRFPTLDQVLEQFRTEMRRLQAYFSAKEYDHRTEMGLRNLRQYYEQHASGWPTNSRTEVHFTQVEVAGVPIKGVIDRIDYLDEQSVAIVDYKTGSHNDSKLKRPTEAKPEGGNYWRQLVFYHLLFQHRGGQTRRAKTGTISYLDRNKDGEQPEYSLSFSPEDISAVKAILQDTYQKIQAHDFYTGCGKPNCDWCRFARDHIMPPGYSRPEIEALDDRL